MKSFFEKVKQGFLRFFQGRNGVDNLSMTMFMVGLILQMADTFAQTGILGFAGMVLYFWAIFRMLSRNTAKRSEEDRRFTERVETSKTKVRQFFVRVKNSRKYKYFKCPQCKAYLRLKRGVGEGTVTCSRCGHSFRKKA